MNNSWNLKGDASTYKKFEKGWASKGDDETASQASTQSRTQPAAKPVTRSGVSSRDNPLVNTHEYYQPSKGASRGFAGGSMYSNPPLPKEQQVQMNK